MNLQRREEIRELIAQFERAQYNGLTTAAEDRALAAMRELLAYIDTLEQTAAELVIAGGRAQAVVVPEIADDELRKMILSAARRKGCIDFDPEDVSDGDLEILREIRDDLASLFRAIPADRVLGDGQIGVRESLSALLLELVAAVDAFLAESSPWIGPGAPSEVPELTEIASRRLQYMFDQIRANQGGDAT